ncbi:MAG: germination protein YpeB [Halanaerobiales bacterium]|nr:germination protein YpeB [Halanaerobiales bacterium]
MKTRWIIPVAVIALLLIGTGIWGYNQYKTRQNLEIFLGNQYKESFYKLVDRCENVNSFLGKGIVANGQEQFIRNLDDCSAAAAAAQEQLNQLPISNATLMKTSKFLTQVGDYCRALSKENLQERTVTGDQRDKLQSLRSQCANLSQALLDLQREVNDGTIRVGELIKGARNTVDDADNQLLSNNFKNLVESNEPFPTLIYDGPFSDHIDQQQPKGLTGGNISNDKGREICTNFVEYDGNPNLVIKDIDNAKGKMPAYQYTIQPNNDSQNHTTIGCSKKGGHVIWFINPREVGDQKITRAGAVQRCDQFLEERNFTDMVPTYSWIEDNVLTISYAYKEDDVIIYPDLIKCKVAMDNGQIVGYEAMGYLMSHRKRDLPESKITESEVRELLSERFDVESTRLALIPTLGLGEKLCWEARCKYQEETYLFYYDVETGEEVNILRVIDAPNGTFAK